MGIFFSLLFESIRNRPNISLFKPGGASEHGVRLRDFLANRATHKSLADLSCDLIVHLIPRFLTKWTVNENFSADLRSRMSNKDETLSQNGSSNAI